MASREPSQLGQNDPLADYIDLQREVERLILANKLHEREKVELQSRIREISKAPLNHQRVPGSVVQHDGASGSKGKEPLPIWIRSCPAWEPVLRKARDVHLLLDPADLSLLGPISQGTFGSTFRARWKGGAEVCVKQVQVCSVEEAATLAREVDALMSVRSPNIVPFLGLALEPLYLVFEYMPGGNLTQWIYGDRGPGGSCIPQRPLADKVRVLLDIARGMCVLEQSHLLHRDLKASNVLLDASSRARIGDFGFARRRPCSDSDVLTGETGTYLYMSPEMIRHEPYDCKTDVFSFAILASEVFVQATPYLEHYLTPVQTALAVAGPRQLRPRLPPQLPPALVDVVQSAWSASPSARPTFAKVCEVLEDVLARLAQEQGSQQPTLVSRILSYVTSGYSTPVLSTRGTWSPSPSSTGGLGLDHQPH